MKSPILSTVCLLAAACTLVAQDGKDRKKRIEKEVRSMREAMQEGKVRTFNVLVRVRLNNGNRLRGVVKHGRFVEVENGLEFEKAARTAKNAGIRLWYTAGSDSYIFLRYEDIKEYEIGDRLTQEQVRAIADKHSEERRVARENYRRMAEKAKQRRQDPAGKMKDQAGKGKATEEKPVPELSKEQAALLDKFPPSEGWGEEKIAKLKKDRIVIGRFPNEKEAEFEKVFSKWKQAYDLSQELAKAKADGEQPAPKQQRPASQPPVPTEGKTPAPGR